MLVRQNITFQFDDNELFCGMVDEQNCVTPYF